MSTTDRIVETQLRKLRDTSDTFVGCAILYFIYNTVFVNKTCDMRVPSRDRWWVVIPLLSA